MFCVRPEFRRVVFAILVLSMVATGRLAAQDQAIDIGTRLELLLDKHIVASMDNARFVLHKPERREVAITFDEDWEGNASGYPTILRDGNLYRMYYRGQRYLIDKKGLRQQHSGVVCYAESKDGIHWIKPRLGIHEWKGSRENNIIWRGIGQHNFAPFIDTNPACKKEERFKAIGGTLRSGLHAFKSADGIHWSKLGDGPIFKDGAFDSRNTVFWDPNRKLYVLYYRYFSKGMLGAGLRLIGESYSKDFLHWSKARPLEYPGSPHQQMYTNNIMPYPRAPHILLGFPTRYVARPLTEHVKTLDPLPLRTQLTEALERAGSDITDGMFMSSRDGITFKRWDEAFLRPGPQKQGRWIYGDNYQGYGLFEAKADEPAEEISFHVSENYWRDGKTCCRRYTCRLDGFVSIQAPLAGGEFVTRPIRFAGRKLIINYATSAAGSVRVEMQDAAGKPLPGHALEVCPELYGDTTRQVVRWKASDVAAFSRTAIRLRFVLKDADLYAFQFVDE